MPGCCPCIAHATSMRTSARRLAEACLKVPRHSYRARGKRGKGGGAYGPFRFAVFDREGEPCIGCGTAIERQEVAGRRLYWCPRCQA